MVNVSLKKIIKNILKWIEVPHSSDETYHEIWVGDMSTRAKQIDSTLTSSSSDSAWMVAVIKAICQDYPNKVGYYFKGSIIPNSRAYFYIQIYSTSAVSNGMPQYAYGTYRRYDNTAMNVAVNNYAISMPPMFKTVSATCAKFTLNANAGNYKNIALSIPSGYELVGPIGVTSSHNQAVKIGALYRANATSITVAFGSNSSSAFTDMTYTVYGLCVLSHLW